VAGLVSHLVSGYVSQNNDTLATIGTVTDALRVAPFGSWLDQVMQTSTQPADSHRAANTGQAQSPGVQDVMAPFISSTASIVVQATGNGGAYVSFPVPT